MRSPIRLPNMLKVNEIFYSIQGESTHAGRPCLFIRLTGCNLRCRYCDTRYAYHSGRSYKIEAILDRFRNARCNLVEITGGEPLLQEETPELCRRLSEQGFEVLVETNGTRNIDCLADGIKRIVDIKCPGSGESEKTDTNNFQRFRAGDEIKFVLTDQTDYQWAKSVMDQYGIPDTVPVLFSPAFQTLDARTLADWILHDRLNVRLQLQLHKIIWPDAERGR